MRVILADNQTIFREGIARICELKPEMHSIAQCVDLQELQACVERVSGAVVLFSATITPDALSLIHWIQNEGCRAVVLLEDDTPKETGILDAAEGVLLRSVSEQQLTECLLRVAAGDRYCQRAIVTPMPPPDQLGAKAARKLTRRELQVVSLVAEGCKNKVIAGHLGTNEQVVKNYLRQIYDKIGVSDRLGLALLKLRHRALAEAVDEARGSLMRIA